jgi:hypothetical protein
MNIYYLNYSLPLFDNVEDFTVIFDVSLQEYIEEKQAARILDGEFIVISKTSSRIPLPFGRAPCSVVGSDKQALIRANRMGKDVIYYHAKTDILDDSFWSKICDFYGNVRGDLKENFPSIIDRLCVLRVIGDFIFCPTGKTAVNKSKVYGWVGLSETALRIYVPDIQSEPVFKFESPEDMQQAIIELAQITRGKV